MPRPSARPPAAAQPQPRALSFASCVRSNWRQFGPRFEAASPQGSSTMRTSTVIIEAQECTEVLLFHQSATACSPPMDGELAHSNGSRQNSLAVLLCGCLLIEPVRHWQVFSGGCRSQVATRFLFCAASWPRPTMLNRPGRSSSAEPPTPASIQCAVPAPGSVARVRDASLPPRGQSTASPLSWRRASWPPSAEHSRLL